MGLHSMSYENIFILMRQIAFSKTAYTILQISLL